MNFAPRWVRPIAIVAAVLAVLGATACSSGQTPDQLQQFAMVTDRDGNSEIYLVDPSTGSSVNLTSHPAFDSRPTWSPDGQRLAFVSDREGGLVLYSMKADGTDVIRLIDLEGVNVHTPEWSPEGSLIAWASDRAQIWTTSMEGVSKGPLTSVSEWALTPSWLPDGRRIAYEATAGVITIDPTGKGRAIVLNRDRLYTRGARWSPDGTRVAFIAGETKEAEGRPMMVDLTSEPIELSTVETDLTITGKRVEWDASGRRIMFDTGGDIWFVEIDSAQVVRLTSSSANEKEGTWRPSQ